MRRYRLFVTLIVCAALYSCAPKIPVQSVTLMQQISDEGERMHRLNIAFINKIFTDKTDEINRFIDREYTPELIAGIKRSIAGQNINMNDEWPSLLQSLTPKINAFKDSLQNALTDGRVKLVTKLNEDYSLYKQACDAQYNLLSSAVKLNEANKMVLNNLAQKLSKGTVDADKVQQTLDHYLQKGSNAAGMIIGFQNDINNLLKP